VLRSSNGWVANDRSVIASYSLPGGRIALRKGDVSVVLLWVANRWHETVEPLQWPGNWGYAERLVRGSSTTISDHASGTAVDLNAPDHPLGVAVTKTFSKSQVKAIRAILEYCDGVVGWGGDYRSRPDGMHLFIRGDAKAVKRIADKIRNVAARRPAAALPKLTPLAAYREDDCMLIKTQPDKAKPVTLTALLSGPMFIALGPTETPTDEQAKAMGIPVLWVEYDTWRSMDRRSENLCGSARPPIRIPDKTVAAPAHALGGPPNPPSPPQK